MILYVLLFVLVSVIAIGALYLAESFRYSGGRHAVYVGSNPNEQGEILLEVVENFIIRRGFNTSDYSLVEPGAGFGYISTYLARRHKWRKVVALEIRPLICLMGNLKSRLTSSKNPVTWLRRDLFGYDFPADCLIYCYLSPSILQELYEKGAFTGQLVVCLTFVIKGPKPSAEYELKSWQMHLRVYDFRTSTGDFKEPAEKTLSAGTGALKK
jgi:hypothetical protein